MNGMRKLSPALHSRCLKHTCFRHTCTCCRNMLLFNSVPLVAGLVRMPGRGCGSADGRTVFRVLIRSLRFTMGRISPRGRVNCVNAIGRRTYGRLLVGYCLIMNRCRGTRRLTASLVGGRNLTLVGTPFKAGISSNGPRA